MSKKVLVLAGGFSAEREVSLVTGRGAAAALRECGYKVIEHDLTDTAALIKTLWEEKPDAVFNALHGNWGEDGEIQGLLDLLQIPYTHSDAANKHKCACIVDGISGAEKGRLTFWRICTARTQSQETVREISTKNNGSFITVM